MAPPGAGPLPLTFETPGAGEGTQRGRGKLRRAERKRRQVEQKARRREQKERRRAERAARKHEKGAAPVADPPEPPVAEPAAEPTSDAAEQAVAAPAAEPEVKEGLWGFLTRERGPRAKRASAQAQATPEPEPSPGLDERAIREAAELEAIARLEHAEDAQEAIEPARQLEAEPEPEPPRLVEAPPAAPPPRVEVDLPEPQREVLLAELERAEDDLRVHQEQEQELSRELAETENRLSETQRRMADALERATEKLREVENRAAEAEQRAERAERLALVRADESERADRLRGMLDRIAQAERRANSAEERAREAVEKISEPLPAIDTESIFGEGERPAAEPSDPPPPAPGGPVSINSATSEELLRVGLSTTQAGRLLAHRERAGGFGSLDELDEVPGIPPEFLTELKTRVRL